MGVQVIINAHCRGICNHNKEVNFISDIIFSFGDLYNLNVWFLIIMMILDFNRPKSLPAMFPSVAPVAAPSHCL